MKRMLLVLLSLFLSIAVMAQFRSAKFSATGTFNEKEKPAVGLGLEKIYVFKSLQGATVSYTTARSNAVSIYTYEDNYISGVKEPVPSENVTKTPIGTDQLMYTVSRLEDSRGLVMVDNNESKAVWVIDYSQHQPTLTSLRVEELADKCDALKLIVEKSDILEYKGTNGQPREIGRRYDLSYDILKWNDDRFVSEVYKDENILLIGSEINLIKIPNLNTRFTLRGDQFGKDFSMATQVVSELYEAASVEAHIITEQREKDSDNQMGESIELGGSAPVEIDFYGFANYPVADYFSWYIFDKKDLKNPVARYTDRDMNYTFEQYGDYVVQFEVSNTRSQCVDTVSVSFNISDSELDIPNYFSPRGTPGSNDVFKVAYKSIVKFKCTIFNRWGNKVYEWNDPAGGWDGRYKGKLVNPGVYYYVIDAVGADGKKYKKGGDINIL